MQPTIADGEVLVSIKVGEISRGDIVTVDMEDSSNLVKRVVAVPGDTLEIKDGDLFINGKVDTSFVSEKGYKYSKNLSVKLNKDEYFVMGDNRDNSLDSRIYGAFDRKEISGRVIFHFY